MDFAVDVVAGWVEALEAQYGLGKPSRERWFAAIELVEQAQKLLEPPPKFRLVK